MLELERFGACILDEDGCTVCGDAGVPVRVIGVAGRWATCEDRTGRRAEVAVDFVPDVQPGDALLVHLGVALVKLQA